MPISSRNTKIYYITQFLYSLVFTIPIWIVYYQGRITIAEISLLVAIQYAAQLFLELPTGAFADLLGRKTSIAIGYFCWALFYLLVIFTSGFIPLLIATVIAGLAESLISGSLEALVYDSLKQDGREHTFAKISAVDGIIFQFGLAIATFSGGFLYQFSWILPYVACAIANGAAFILALFFIEPKIDTEKFSLQNYLRQMTNGTKHAFETKKVALMSTFYVAVSAITWTNNLYFFDFMLVELGFSDQYRSVIGAIIRIVNVTVLGTLLRNDHIFTRNRSIFFFPLIMALCFLPGILFSGWWALPFVAGAVMAGTARWIVLTRYTNEMFESKYRATAISALSMLVGILFVIITLVSGPIIERFGGVRMMYSLLGLTTLCTVLPLAFAVVRNGRKV
jgi:MFS family permease